MGGRILAAVLALAMLAGPVWAQELTDHPLVTRYPGSHLTHKAVEDFERYPVITGLAELDFTSRAVEGTVTRLRYESPGDRSVREIFANYEQGLAAAGLEELWRCTDRECGPAFAAARWGRFNGTINLGADSRYLAGRMTTANGEAFVVVAVAPRQHQLVIVEVNAMEGGLITVDPDALGEALDLYGHVAIPGVFFATGSAVIEPQSDVAMAAMAEILNRRPDARVWVVGHTDWTGTLELNMRLSDARAKAVVAALVERYGIAAGRLVGYGVGPLAPQAANNGEAGRAGNRRVELVLQP